MLRPPPPALLSNHLIKQNVLFNSGSKELYDIAQVERRRRGEGRRRKRCDFYSGGVGRNNLNSDETSEVSTLKLNSLFAVEREITQRREGGGETLKR